MRLDVSREEALARAAELIGEAWRSFDHFRPGQPPIGERVRALTALGLPEGPSPALGVLDDAALALDESLAQPRPRFFAFVGSSALEIAVIGDALASCFDPNLAAWAAAATEIERQTVDWVSSFVGYPAKAGSFTSGGTISNLTALAAARERAVPGARRDGLHDRRLAVYCSSESHYSTTRAAELLGVGSAGIRALPLDPHRRLDPVDVAAAIDTDRAAGIVPVAVIATAGTTLTGAVDPIDELADVCAERDLWLHVDGAYGLPAAAVPATAEMFAGVERADSVSIDAHKWLFMPKACGVLLVRRREDLEAALAHEEDYLPHERDEPHAVDITLEYSRPFRALKLWLGLRAHGAAAFRDAIERNLAQARVLYDAVLAHDELEPVCGPPSLSIVPFRHAPPGIADIDEHNSRLILRLQESGRVWVAPARIDGKVCLRPCIVNFRTTDEDVLAIVEEATRIGSELRTRD